MTEQNSLLIALDEIMADYGGSLDRWMTAQPEISDVFIYWAVSVDVKGRGEQKFFVGVAVCFTDMLAEEAKDQLAQLAGDDADFIFAYIPAWQYGQNDFGIYVEQTTYGDILTNSLVSEVIDKAAVEQTLKARCLLS